MIILSIETSCDETAAAIVNFKNNKVKVLANVVSSQIKMHSEFGGVVPSLASRMHLKNITPVLRQAFRFAKIDKNKIDYIAATNGPGLIPALMLGVGAAKALSYALDKPIVPIHHIEGHIYANWLKPIGNSKLKTQNSKLFELWAPQFPILCLTVSGGHTQIVLIKKDLNYEIIGETLDDAAGEAFDKVAKLLGLGYPGGPIIEKIAKQGNRNKFKFPRPMMNSKDYNFSFSGLKTAVLYEMRNRKEKARLKNPDVNFNSAKLQDSPISSLSEGKQNIPYPKLPITDCPLQYQADIAASFQQAVIDVLISKTIKAAEDYKIKNIILGGGVSANKELRKQFDQAVKKELPFSTFHFPLAFLTTDNSLMIAIAAYKRIMRNKGIKTWKNIKANANLRLK